MSVHQAAGKTFIKAVAGQLGYGEGDQQRAADTIELHIDGILTYYDYRISIENEEGNLRKVMIKNVKNLLDELIC